MKQKSSKARSNKNLRKPVLFEFFAPQANSIGVGGTFNQWQASKHPLKKTPQGKWKAEIMLPPGRHEYRYEVDGEWQNEQRSCECVPNAFGTWNCVVVVR